MTFGLLLETWLMIIRTNMPQRLEDRFPMLFGQAYKDALKACGDEPPGPAGSIKVLGSVKGGKLQVRDDASSVKGQATTVAAAATVETKKKR